MITETAPGKCRGAEIWRSSSCLLAPMADPRNIGRGASVLSGMFPANSHTIRPATAHDAIALRRLAAASGVSPLAGRILVAEHDDVIIAALSLGENRTIASDLAPSYVTTLLRLRADGIEAYEREPRLSERIREAVLGPRQREMAKAA